jgi:hypothetical protein
MHGHISTTKKTQTLLSYRHRPASSRSLRPSSRATAAGLPCSFPSQLPDINSRPPLYMTASWPPLWASESRPPLCARRGRLLARGAVLAASLRAVPSRPLAHPRSGQTTPSPRSPATSRHRTGTPLQGKIAPAPDLFQRMGMLLSLIAW